MLLLSTFRRYLRSLLVAEAPFDINYVTKFTALCNQGYVGFIFLHGFIRLLVAEFAFALDGDVLGVFDQILIPSFLSSFGSPLLLIAHNFVDIKRVLSYSSSANAFSSDNILAFFSFNYTQFPFLVVHLDIGSLNRSIDYYLRFFILWTVCFFNMSFTFSCSFRLSESLQLFVVSNIR